MNTQGLKSVLKDSKGVVFEKKIPDSHREIDSASALQSYLNHIPVESIPRITTTQVVEIKSDECVIDAIKLLYEKNVFGAPIVDVLDVHSKKFWSPYIGSINFARMVLWSLEVGELANSYIWDPFFPVHLDDSLFHVMLLLSKHRLQAVPVIDRSISSHVIGFVTQAAVIEMLLQSSGLEWFDGIADKALSEFRFENDGCSFCIYGNQSIAEAFHSLWENKKNQIAVLNRETTKLIGVVRTDDLRILLDDDEVFHNRMSLKVEEFIDVDARESIAGLDPILDKHLGAKNKFKMTSAATNKEKDTLKHVMEVLIEKQSNCSFLVDDLRHVKGKVTMRDIIMQFSPPLMDSTIDGGGFFQSALEHTGC
ncbi:hypothetical protein AQUCO_00700254v1 [Aquilegia coerulea]|uniref:CBS domain-containing protein n=1 Tax=Aquilegia coerulea TaxID=218851 RepID=A0A2G5EJA1_AQUCA|nr:hypothetical protein AQUCO_00700254v1 [Aquilegia coerulea]